MSSSAIKIAQHEGELGNDVELGHLLRNLEGFLRASASTLVHATKHFVRARLGSQKNHAQPAFAHQTPRASGVTEQGIDACLSPPTDTQVQDPLGEFRRSRLVHEEVVVVELHRIRTKLSDESSSDPSGSFRRLREPTSLHHVDDGAEVARKGAAVARVVG